MNPFRRLLPRGGFLAAAAGVVLLCAGAVRPQTPPPQQPPPRIAFAQTEAITLKPGSTSETVLVNNTAGDIVVTVQVLAADPAEQEKLEKALIFTKLSDQPLKAGQGTVIKLGLPPDNAEGFGLGFLIAVEKDKAYARREIKPFTPAPKSPPSPPSPTPTPKEPSAPVETLEAVNLSGTNFLPSLLGRVSTLISLILLIVMFLIGVWAVRTSLFKSAAAKGGAAVLLTAMLLVLWVAGVNGWETEKFSWVVSPQLSLTSQKHTGGLISADGSLGKLEADGQQLKATHLPRAGTYTGYLKIGEGMTAKDLKVVASVSDWWPYAFIAISLGVLLGYYTTRYFKQQRAEDEQGARAAQLWLRISEDESRFQLEHGGEPYAGYGIVAASKSWLDGVGRGLSAHDAAGVKGSLDCLEAYFGTFTQFRDKVLALNKSQAGVWEMIRRDEPELGRNRAVVIALREADEALKGQPLPHSADEEQQSTTLKGYQSRVQAILEWLRALEKTIITTNGYLRSASTLTSDEETLKKFKDARRAAILAAKKEDMMKVEEQAAAAYASLLQAAQVNLPEGAKEATARAGAAHAGFRPFAPSGAQVSNFSQTPVALIGDGRDPDDLHVFTADVTAPADQRALGLRWDFGDGITSEVPPAALARGETVTIRVSHRYGEGGSYTAAIEESTGRVLKTLNVAVDRGPGRAARLLAAFRLAEWQMSVVAGLIAVGLGFYTLYVSKTVWGTPADYLNAVLWGSVVSEGLKYAANLVDRVWAR